MFFSTHKYEYVVSQRNVISLHMSKSNSICVTNRHTRPYNRLAVLLKIKNKQIYECFKEAIK